MVQWRAIDGIRFKPLIHLPNKLPGHTAFWADGTQLGCLGNAVSHYRLTLKRVRPAALHGRRLQLLECVQFSSVGRAGQYCSIYSSISHCLVLFVSHIGISCGSISFYSMQTGRNGKTSAPPFSCLLYADTVQKKYLCRIKFTNPLCLKQCSLAIVQVLTNYSLYRNVAISIH